MNLIIQATQERREVALGKGLALAISDLIVTREYARLEGDLQQIMGNESVKSVLVTDLSGKVLAYLKRNHNQEKSEPDFLLTQISTPKNLAGDFTIKKENDISKLWYKVDYGIALGWIRIESFNNFSDELLSNFRYNIFVSVFILFIGLFGTALAFFNRTKQKAKTDISEIKKASAEREVRLQEMQENQRLNSLGVLVAGLAHEINNPLGIALTATTYIGDSAADLRKNIAHLESTDLADFLEDQETAFQLIADNLKRASNLVVGFKDIASDRVLDDLKEINLRDYVRSIEQSLTPVLKNAHCKLSLDIDPTIFMQVNTGSLSQLITNLVLNATIHAFSGVKDCQIQIAGKQDSQHIFLKISDNGNGIPAHVLPNLFTPFYTTKRADGGTGLGLYVSRQIATDILMGRLSVQNLPDKGCEFTLEIPRH